MAQTHEDKHLIIIDDGGTVPVVCGHQWTVIQVLPRLNSLPEKYNRVLSLLANVGQDDRLTEAQQQSIGRHTWDAVAVWDDDDIYLPHHLSSLGDALLSNTESGWAKHSHVISDYVSYIGSTELSTGRFHGSIMVRWEALQDMGGWPNTDQVDYDQVFMRSLLNRYGPPASSDSSPPSYCYRWAGTRANHASAYPGNEYQTKPMQFPDAWENLDPRFDKQTKDIYKAWNGVNLR